MDEAEDEGEAAMAAVDMADPHPPRRQPAGQAQPDPAELRARALEAESAAMAAKFVGVRSTRERVGDGTRSQGVPVETR